MKLSIGSWGIKSAFWLAGGSAIALMATPSFAQDAQSEALDENNGLETIVVTARKTSENVQDVPLAISAFSTERMADLNLKTPSDIAYQTPGFTVFASPGDAHAVQLGMRGQFQGDIILTVDSPISAYIDGVYLPRTLGLTAALVDIERVEVLKGPQGTLFGKNTTGGALSIITRKPDLDTFSGYASGSYGNYNAYSLESAVNLPIVTDKLAVRVVGRYSTHDPYGHDALGNGIDGDKDFYVRGELLWKPVENVSLLLSADYTKLKSSGTGNHLSYVGSIADILNPSAAAAAGRAATPGAFLALVGSYGLQNGLITPAQLGAVLTPPTSPAFNPAAFGAALPAFFGAEAKLRSTIGAPASGFYDSNQGGGLFSNFKSNGFSGTLAIESGDITVKSITAYRKYVRDNAVDFDATTAVLLGVKLQQNPHTFSQELQIGKNNGRGIDWLLGAYYSVEEGVESSEAINLKFANPGNPGYTYGLVNNKSLAFFAQGKYALSDQLRLTAGIRYTTEDKSLISRNRVVDFDLSAAVANNHCSVIAVIDVAGVCQSYPLKNGYGAWDYLVSIDYKPNDDLLFYARTARGFKSGGANLRGQNLATFAPFNPEVVTEYEIGAKLDLLDRRVRVNLSAYYDKDKNLQRNVTLQGPSGGLLSIITNAASAKVKGVEAEVNVAPVHGLTLTGSMAYTDAKYIEFSDLSGPGGTLRDRSDESFAVPKWTYTIGGTYALPVGDDEFRININWAYRGTSQLSGTALAANLQSQTQRGYGLLGGRLAYSISSIDAEISAFGSNILKKKYYAGGVALDSALGINFLQPGRPRTFGIEIKKSF